MNENRVKRNRLLGDRVIRGLESRNMEGYYAETKEEALKKALELIPEGSSLSWGGSMTIAEIGLKEAVCSGNYKVYNRDAAKNPEEKRAAELAAYDCDFFLTSANAVTEDGEMINVDGFANRVSAIAAGPRTVLVIAGMNKVVKSLEDAYSRARNEAAPIAKIWPGYALLKKWNVLRLQIAGHYLLPDPDHEIFKDQGQDQGYLGR